MYTELVRADYNIYFIYLFLKKKKINSNTI